MAEGEKSIVVCAICLEEAGLKGQQGTGELSGCAHIFCYPCILEWSKVTNSCPLCKQRFTRLTQSQGSGSVQRVVRVTEKEQQHEYDMHDLQATYGEGGTDNSFIDDRSDGEIEREEAAEDDSELRWLRREQQERESAKSDDTGAAVFSQDGRRLRNTRARKRREANKRSQEKAEETQAASQAKNERARKRPRVTRQSTIAEVLQRAQDTQQPKDWMQREQHRAHTQEDSTEVILLDEDWSSAEPSVDTRLCHDVHSSSDSPGSGSSCEQYTPTQLWVMGSNTRTSDRAAKETGRTIADYFPSSQEAAPSTPAHLSPVQLSPASSDPCANLSACFPLTRSLGLSTSSSQSQSHTNTKAKKPVTSRRRNAQGSKGSKEKGSSTDKENRPNIPSLFFSLSPFTSASQTNGSSPHCYTSSPVPSPSPSPSPSPLSSFAIPHAPSSRSTSFQLYATSSSSCVHSYTAASPPFHGLRSPSSSSATISTSTSSTTISSSSLPIPSILTQHLFQALSAVRAELMPFFKKNVLSSGEFRVIAKKVSDQYLEEERSGLAKKSLCLTPRRKQKIKHLVERALDRIDAPDKPA